MPRIFAILCFAILLSPPLLAAQEIVSVVPDIATVGTAVTLSGGPFPESTRIVLGSQEIIPTETAERFLVFTVPPLASGEYALRLRIDGRLAPGIFSLRVVEPMPRILAVSPANIDECAAPDDRRVTVSGEDFSPGARLLLDGAVVAAERVEATEIRFAAPALKGGIHQLQVVNSAERKSLPATLFVNSIPEIHSAEQGADDVTSYELIIRGKNFLFNSALIVDGTPIGQALLTGGNQTLVLPETRPASDSIRYVDCNTIVYVRHPYSRQAKRVSLQVVNHGGNQSPVYYVTIP